MLYGRYVGIIEVLQGRHIGATWGRDKGTVQARQVCRTLYYAVLT